MTKLENIFEMYPDEEFLKADMFFEQQNLNKLE
jgi:hypothetical protein